MREDDLAPIKDVLGPITRRLGLPAAGDTAAIWGRWATIVGDDLARRAEPTSVRDGILRVRTDSPVWATEIGYLAEEIARRVNDEVGSEVVREVRVWTGRGRPKRSPGRSVEGTVERGKADEPPADPATALARARAAWERRRDRRR